MVVKQAGGDDRGGEGERPQVKARFLVLLPFGPAAGQQPGVEHEADGAECHKDYEPPLDGGAAKGGDAGVFGAEAAGGDGGEGMTDGIEERHAKGDEAEQANGGEADVNLPEAKGGVAHTGGEPFAELGAGFIAEEGFRAAAASGDGEYSDEEHEDSHAAEPLGGGAPEKDAAREDFNIGHGRGTGGGEAGGRFKNGGGGIERGL